MDSFALPIIFEYDKESMLSCGYLCCDGSHVLTVSLLVNEVLQFSFQDK